MYVDHPVFPKPQNSDAVIWRYLSFTKFVSLIVSRSLFFSGIPSLRQFDPFEGTLPTGNLKLREMTYRELYHELPTDEARQRIESLFLEEDSNIENFLIPYLVINCWHMNPTESAAMWKLYLPGGEGIAIQSTFERLTKCFIQVSGTPVGHDGKAINVFVGLVEYVDHEEGIISEGNLFYRVTHKDPSFAYEHELRAVALLPPIGKADPDKDVIPQVILDLKRNGGISFPIDLQILIESIVLPPTCPDWIKELTRSLLVQYGLNIQVRDSKLRIRFG